MKIKLLIAAFIFLSLNQSIFGQNNIEKYCAVSFEAKGSSLNIGSSDSLFRFKDNSILDKLRKVERYSSALDVLNYMGQFGWTVITIQYFANMPKIIFFKKTFDKSELLKKNE
jgi:hypothetical protein